MTREASTVSSTRLRQTAAAVALAALALTGCSANEAGSASIVGDQSVTVAQVADVAAEVQAQVATVNGATFDEKSATIASLTSQTRHLILQAVAAKEGITVTQGQIDAFVKNIVDGQFGGKRQALLDNLASQSNIPASRLEAAAADQLVYDALLTKIAPAAATAEEKSKAFTDYMTAFVPELGVAVAPRFGTWNVFALGPVPDDLSVAPAPIGDGSGRPVTLPNPAG
jgi:uncharacterized protein YcfL